VIDRRCQWELGCSISGWRSCKLRLRSSRSAEVDGTDGAPAQRQISGSGAMFAVEKKEPGASRIGVAPGSTHPCPCCE
jgi:hypothetical protein